MKCQIGDLYISQNKRSAYVSVQAIKVDRKPNSHEINKRFIWEWINRHGEKTRNSAYVRDVEAWVDKNNALRIETTPHNFKAHVLGYILPEENWPLTSDQPNTIRRDAAAPYIRAVVGFSDYLDDMQQQTVILLTYYSQIASLQSETVRLREALDQIRLIPFPMMDLPAGIMHGIAHKALKGGAA